MQAASKVPLFSTPSSKSRFQRPFIKPASENKENQKGDPQGQKPLENKGKTLKKSVFTENIRKNSLGMQENMLSPGHGQNSGKLMSFKSPQRPNPAAFNIKGPIEGSTSQPSLGLASGSNRGMEKPQGGAYIDSKSNKGNLLDRMKTFSSELVQSTKSFINYKINHLKQREKCACSAGLNGKQTCELAFSWLFKRYAKKDLGYLQTVYANLQKNQLVEESVKTQVQRDLLRTYPNCEFFKENHEGVGVLERVLLTFASYDPQIGYVQGMNYIAGFFAYHAEEYIAFWLLASFFELFELRDVYLPNLPGLSKHLQIVDVLLLSQLPGLYKHFAANGISSEMYCAPWIFSLFGMVIPLEELKQFYECFIEKGWPFFYQIVLGFLKLECSELLSADSMGVLQLLTQNNYRSLRPEDYKRNREYWHVLLRTLSKDSSTPVNSQLISKLHSNFDSETRTFKILINSP